jgi:ABC-type multidrug transport system fused ATPase/permease subunit
VSWQQIQITIILKSTIIFIFSDIERMREGFGDKLSLIAQYITTFITGFIIGFTNLWQLTLVMIALTPVTAATASYIGRVG